MKPPKGLGFPFGGAFQFRPFQTRRSKFIALTYPNPKPRGGDYAKEVPEGANVKAPDRPTETATTVASEAMQIFGGYGLAKEFPIEKMFRDARASMIEDGVNDALAIKAAEFMG